MSDGFVLVHRMIAWEHGILVDLSDEVHHVNEDKHDNSPTNLVAKSPSRHAIEHLAERGTVSNQYGIWELGQGKNTRRLAFKESLGQRSCEMCGKDITELRADAVVCGNNCRITRWKHRNRGIA